MSYSRRIGERLCHLESALERARERFDYRLAAEIELVRERVQEQLHRILRNREAIRRTPRAA